MKRLLAILLLLALGLPGALPLFALSIGAEDGKAPSCCRRNGKHHCTSPGSVDSSSEAVTLAAIPSHCPFSPSALPANEQVTPALATFSTLDTALAASPVAAISIVPAPGDVFSFNRPTRGPPAVTLNIL